MGRGLACVIAFLAAATGCARSQAPDEGWRSVAVEAIPVELGAEQVGALQFRGGLELRAQEEAFGGLSGLAVWADGRLLAVTDAGFWVLARIGIDEETGSLSGLYDVQMAPLRDGSGRVFPSKAEADAEGLAILPDGRVAVSFEQSQLVRIYDLERLGPAAPAQAGTLLAGADALSRNRGLEALAVAGDGRLVAGSERGPRIRPSPIWVVPAEASDPIPPAASMPLELGFGLVSLDRLPSGDFVALERFFAPLVGLRIRVVLVDGEALLGSPAQLIAREAALLAPPLLLDNFEAVAATPLGEGRVRLFMLSDDNFSASQRTLLYAFDWTYDPERAGGGEEAGGS